MPNIILLNGPARSGKDYAATVLMNYFKDTEDIVHFKLSTPLKELVSSILGETLEVLELTKDEMTDTTLRSSYRDLQIAVFQSVSQIFGEGWLGNILTNKIKHIDENTIIVSDAGRNNDIVQLIKYFGASSILVIHVLRKGTNFDYDIREYINDPRVKREMVFNDGTERFGLEIVDTVLQFVGGS